MIWRLLQTLIMLILAILTTAVLFGYVAVSFLVWDVSAIKKATDEEYLDFRMFKLVKTIFLTGDLPL